jgi:hypothetical protein
MGVSFLQTGEKRKKSRLSTSLNNCRTFNYHIESNNMNPDEQERDDKPQEKRTSPYLIYAAIGYALLVLAALIRYSGARACLSLHTPCPRNADCIHMMPGQCPSAFLDYVSIVTGSFWWNLFSTDLYSKTIDIVILSRLLNGVGISLVLTVLYNIVSTVDIKPE